MTYAFLRRLDGDTATPVRGRERGGDGDAWIATE
jgi:hypothetical protein